MKTRIALFILLMILALTAAQYSWAAGPIQQTAATATPTPAGDASEPEQEHNEPMAEDAADQPVMVVEPGQAFQVAIATYLMDTAGFHGIDERLNGEGVIEAGDAGVVNRISQVLAATHWPEALQAQVDPLQETLAMYAEALSNDDVEAAKPLATQAHEQQHELSHAVEHWLGQVGGSASTMTPQEQMFQATVATYLMDTAGFHGIDERLNGEGVIDPGDAGVVNRVNGVLAATAWPAELQAQVETLKATLSQYAEALSGDDVEAAKPLATQAHEQQHELSHAVEHWLGEMSGSAEHGAGKAGHEHDESEEEGN
jgi:hypothetical protein